MSGVKAAFTLVKEPISTPSGKAIATASAKPSITRPKETNRLRVSARSNQSSGNDLTTSAGEGRIVGEMTRSSATPVRSPRPRAASRTATGSIPSSHDCQAGSGSRIRSRPA